MRLYSAHARPDAELRALFTDLLLAVADAEAAGPVHQLHSNMIRGFELLPVLLHRRRP
ncbi:hypothetical protein WJ438_34400 [Streptomyces sp. GD-15H]|uniref:hypothetical protein n=1 Tax=Streptomyces sp. GD-15H TaxID=3129112 RepID=UPI00325600C4